MKMIKNLVQRERWGSLRYEMLLLVSESNTRPQSVYSRPLSDVSVTPSIDPYRINVCPPIQTASKTISACYYITY